MLHKQTLSIAEATKVLGVGRSTLYALIKDGRLPVRKLGSRTLVLSTDLATFITALPASGGTNRK